MTEGIQLRRRIVGRVSIITALLSTLLIGLGENPAASAAGNVTSVIGSAYGYRAFNITLFGGVQPNKGPTPRVALAANASNSPQSAYVLTGLVQYGPATLFTSDRINVSASGSLGATGSATSSTGLRNINKATTQSTTGSEIFTADLLTSRCTKTESGGSRVTRVTNGTLQTDSGFDANGDGDYTDAGEHPPVIVPIAAAPARQTTYRGHIHLSATSQDNFTVVFNEHITNANGSLTVNAVHEYFLGPTLRGHLVLGQAVCGVTAS